MLFRSWGLIALRHGGGTAWIEGKWEGIRRFRQLRRRSEEYEREKVQHPEGCDRAWEISDSDVSDQVEQTDRAYWEKKRDPTSLTVMDEIVSALRSRNIDPRLTYNKYHIALGSTGNNFCWFHPRKSAGYCHIEFRLNSESRDAALASLQGIGIDAFPRKTDIITFGITTKNLAEHMAEISGSLATAEEMSRR